MRETHRQGREGRKDRNRRLKERWKKKEQRWRERETHAIINQTLISSLTLSFGGIKASGQFLFAIPFQSITFKWRSFPFLRLSRIMSNLQRKRLLLLFWKRNIIYPHKWSITFSHCKELICHSWDQTLIHSNYMVHRIRWQYVIILNHDLLLRQELVLLLLVNKPMRWTSMTLLKERGQKLLFVSLWFFFFF